MGDHMFVFVMVASNDESRFVLDGNILGIFDDKEEPFL